MRNKNIINILYEVLFYLSIFAYMLVIKSIYSTNVPYDLKVFFGFALVIIGICILVGGHANKYVSLVLCAIYTLYLVAQKTYYKGFGSYFRFSTAKELSSEVTGQGAAINELFDMKDLIPFLIFLLLVVAFLIIRYCFKIKTKYKWYVHLSSLLCFLLSFVSINSMIKQINSTNTNDNFQIYHTDFYLYDTVSNPKSFVDNLGLLTFEFRDLQSLIDNKKNTELYKEKIDEFFYNKNSIKESNDYTGLFKDKSLLIIQAESLNSFGINEELTPTLYKMINNSIQITNFDTPLLIGSTSDSEFMANTSFIPEAEGYSVCYQYVNNTYPLTLGNLFKNNGYSTNAFHNNFGEYYNRFTTFNNYGYEFFDSYGLGIESEASDTLVSEQIGWIDVEKEKFVSLWISYSGHQPYGLEDVGVNKEDVETIKKLYPNLNDDYVSYLAKTMDFDKAVEQFLNVMEWMGRIDDVVVVIYGDHVAKGLDLSRGTNFDEVFGVNSDDNPSITYTPLFIYANDMEHQVIDKYCTALDILPTLMNLWGIDYNDDYAFGHDILDDDYRGFCFDANGNYWNNDFYFNSTNNAITTYNGYSEDSAREIVNDFNKKREVCKEILMIDYFKK
ncbi:MAG: LTA synthase family protein [Solobacterium sp.]|nr:sulfatase-like hydrolase/transferase [Solobacterium sp.]MDD7775815.1 LTA synthase family protein [Solobacterium sp.]MDY2953826.1 LTA synthase family protein [Erysipelotrichaceae bacterium]